MVMTHLVPFCHFELSQTAMATATATATAMREGGRLDYVTMVVSCIRGD